MQSLTPAKNSPGSFAAKVLALLATLYFLLLACVVAYIWLIAQDRFLTDASFKISRQDVSGGEVGFAQLALPGISDTGSVDSQIAIGFVNSTDSLLELEKEFNLREHYATPPHDFVFRLDSGSPLEDRLKHYRNRISAHFDKETGLTLLTVDTFDPALSRAVAESLLRKTEVFINTLNQTIADQQLSFVRDELERAEKRVADISLELLELQNKNDLISPDATVAARLSVIQTLKMDRIRMETMLATLERDSPGSPRVETSRSQLRSLNERIAIESAKLSGPEQDNLNQILARFKELELKLGFAIQMRAGAATLLEKNRVDAVARSRFLSVIQRPYLAEAASYPRRFYATATIIALGLLLFLILRVLVHSVYERRH